MIDATAIEEDGPVQMKVHKPLKLWSFYVDMEESLRTLNYTCAVYVRILILQIATQQFSIMPIFLR
jgi:pre-mRNA-splicing factor SYF1